MARISDFRVLAFDCYGTLIDWESGLLAALRPWQRRAGIKASDEKLLEAFAETESAIQAEHPTMLYPDTLATALRKLAARYQSAATAEEARGFGQSVKDWPAFPDSAAALDYLKRHYKLVIVSNVDRRSFAESNRKLGVEFDLVVTAEDVGSYKPALGHFEKALAELARMGIKKSEVLHTAQSLFHDHVPAKRMGLTSIWINRRAGKGGGGATKPPPVPVKPDWEVPSMAAMVELHRRETAK
jgi:2-haloalkanoic acid dehalogenase type II